MAETKNNVVDNTNLTNHQGDYNGANSEYWISQINAGGKVYDIATHHNITFRDGNGGATTVWNGLTDIEVVIPTIKDIVQSPIEFAGTVDKDGKIIWNTGFGSEPKSGNLVFVTADCTFKVSSTDTTGISCEAGDMAVYDGSKWNVVSGENQVQIVTASGTTSSDGNTTTIAIGAAKNILTIEGKKLALTIDYKDLNDNHLNVEGGEEVYVDFNEATVGSKYIKLTQGEGTNITIANDVIVKEATALKNGAVTFNETKVVKSVELPTLNSGKFPVYSKNSEKSLQVSGGSLTAGDGSDFVKNVTFGQVTFDDADSGDTNKITAVTNITSDQGAEFLNGIHITGEGETADLTITGHIAPTKGMSTVFVEGLEDKSTSVVTSLNAGSFKLVEGSDIATGFGAQSDSGDVISSITVTPNNNASVLNEAKVENHVLSFGTTSVTNGVTVEKKYKSLQKKGFEYKSATANSSNFVTSGFEAADDVNLTFSKAKETTYSFDTHSWKIVTPTLGVDKGAYTINHTNMNATLPKDLFFSGISDAGTLPSFSNAGKVTDFTLTGSVATDLEIKDNTISAVKDGVTTITIPGAYSLVDGSKGDGVEVGMAGSLDSIEATIDLSSYITNVTITE